MTATFIVGNTGTVLRSLPRMERGEPEPRTISVPLLSAGGGW